VVRKPVAVITGANSLTGFEVDRRLVDDGYAIALVDSTFALEPRSGPGPLAAEKVPSAEVYRVDFASASALGVALREIGQGL
jgi:NAD(P)-dependent dehydrogenase (short-subunit alcohol dehydrogenase family)